MSVNTKPSVVFAHGLWADGSCFQKLIPTLQAEGHEVICSQHGLDSLKSDVQCVTRCFGRVHPDLERFVAKRMGATTAEVDSSDVPMLSNPGLVLDVIRKAADAVQKA